jgi:hypothetical protein
MEWDEFSELLKSAPKDKWLHYLHEAGIYNPTVIDKLMQTSDENVMTHIFIEMEEQL